MSKKKLLLIGVDDGYAQTKVYGECPERGMVKYKMRSSARAGRDGLGTISGLGGVSCYKTPEGDIFTVSDSVEGESTRFDGFHTSTLNRVLVHHALLQAGFGGREIHVVTGLPIEDYFLDGLKDEDKIAEKRKNLMRPVTSISSSIALASIRQVEVGSQAVAAWIDWILDDDLNERQDPQGTVAIVDIGGRTTDIAVVVAGASIDHAHSGTENIGVLDVYEALARALRQRYRIRERFPMAVMDRAVREKTIPLWGKDNDVADLVRDARIEVEGKLAREIQRKIGYAANLNAVLFVGGGAELFRKVAESFRNGAVVEDPEFSNARGLYKYTRYFE